VAPPPTSRAVGVANGTGGEAGVDQSVDALGHRAGRDERSFFGPVLTEIPRGAEAVSLWGAVDTLAAARGFSSAHDRARRRAAHHV